MNPRALSITDILPLSPLFRFSPSILRLSHFSANYGSQTAKILNIIATL